MKMGDKFYNHKKNDYKRTNKNAHDTYVDKI